MFEAREVTKRYGGRAVLTRVSLQVNAGERVVVRGENGSGKSTLLSIAAGVIDADGGLVRVSRPLGYAPERPDLADHLSVTEWLGLVASLAQRPPPADDALADWGLADVRSLSLGALSLGQKQRVSLLAALSGDPQIVILDEPTNALDQDALAALTTTILGKTALIATHDEAFIRKVATRVVTMSAGRLDVTDDGSRHSVASPPNC